MNDGAIRESGGSKAPVRILVVGLGNMGASHASAYHRLDGFEIVGLCSRSIRSKEIPEELSGYPLFENYETALAELGPTPRRSTPGRTPMRISRSRRWTQALTSSWRSRSG